MSPLNVVPLLLEEIETREADEPHEHVVVPDGKCWVIVLGRIRYVSRAAIPGSWQGAGMLPSRNLARMEHPSGQEVVDADHDDTAILICGPVSGSITRKPQRGVNAGRLEEEHVVGIDHRGVRGIPVRPPHGPTVELGQTPPSRHHAGEPPEPGETVGIVEIGELAEYRHPGSFLRFDQLALEEVDEDIALRRVERVAAQLHQSLDGVEGLDGGGLIAHHGVSHLGSSSGLAKPMTFCREGDIMHTLSPGTTVTKGTAPP